MANAKTPSKDSKTHLISMHYTKRSLCIVPLKLFQLHPPFENQLPLIEPADPETYNPVRRRLRVFILDALPFERLSDQGEQIRRWKRGVEAGERGRVTAAGLGLRLRGGLGREIEEAG